MRQSGSGREYILALALGFSPLLPLLDKNNVNACTDEGPWGGTPSGAVVYPLANLAALLVFVMLALAVASLFYKRKRFGITLLVSSIVCAFIEVCMATVICGIP